MNKKYNFTIKSILILSFSIFSTNSASLRKELNERDEKNERSVAIIIREYIPSIEELNYELRNFLLASTGIEDEETLKQYRELLKMVHFVDLDNMEYAINYTSGDYTKVDSNSYSSSDQFFSRILYPSTRDNDEYSNWLISIQLNPKAQFILVKAAASLSSWDDALYILSKTRPDISDIQLTGLKNREYLLRNPMPELESSQVDISSSDFIYNQVTYCFLSTIKKPFSDENLITVKSILIRCSAVAMENLAVKIITRR